MQGAVAAQPAGLRKPPRSRSYRDQKRDVGLRRRNRIRGVMLDRHTLHHFFHKTDLIQEFQEHDQAAKWRQGPIRLLQRYLPATEKLRPFRFHPSSLRWADVQ